MTNQIICAAIRFTDGRIIRGHRHDSCFKTAMGYAGITTADLHAAEQGFMDARNEFVSREEAIAIQRAAGKYTGRDTATILFSEDCY